MQLVLAQQEAYDSQWAAIKLIAGEDGLHPGDAAEVGAANRAI